MNGRGKKEKKSMREEVKSISWKERKCIADRDEEALKQDIQDLHTWTNMIDGMNDQQLKGYIENRPEQLRTIKVQKSIIPRPKIQRNAKPKSSASNNGVIMASLRKFNKEDQDDKLNIK